MKIKLNYLLCFIVMFLISCGLTTEPVKEEPFIIKTDYTYGGKPTINVPGYDVTSKTKILYD